MWSFTNWGTTIGYAMTAADTSSSDNCICYRTNVHLGLWFCTDLFDRVLNDANRKIQTVHLTPDGYCDHSHTTFKPGTNCHMDFEVPLGKYSFSQESPFFYKRLGDLYVGDGSAANFQASSLFSTAISVMFDREFIVKWNADDTKAAALR
jgi:hypothetical protein